MPKSNKDLRNIILEVSEKLFLENGFEKTSTRQIAKEANIASGTLFNYFPNKVDLFYAIIKKHIGATLTYLEEVISIEDENSCKIYFLIKALYSKIRENKYFGKDFVKFGMESPDQEDIEKLQDIHVGIFNVIKKINRIFIETIIEQYNIDLEDRKRHTLEKFIHGLIFQIPFLIENYPNEHDENQEYIYDLYKSYINKIILND